MHSAKNGPVKVASSIHFALFQIQKGIDIQFEDLDQLYVSLRATHARVCVCVWLGSSFWWYPFLEIFFEVRVSVDVSVTHLCGSALLFRGAQFLTRDSHVYVCGWVSLCFQITAQG